MKILVIFLLVMGMVAPAESSWKDDAGTVSDRNGAAKRSSLSDDRLRGESSSWDSDSDSRTDTGFRNEGVKIEQSFKASEEMQTMSFSKPAKKTSPYASKRGMPGKEKSVGAGESTPFPTEKARSSESRLGADTSAPFPIETARSSDSANRTADLTEDQAMKMLMDPKMQEKLLEKINEQRKAAAEQAYDQKKSAEEMMREAEKRREETLKMVEELEKE